MGIVAAGRRRLYRATRWNQFRPVRPTACPANVSLSGLLNVGLAVGFTPPLGSRFQVLCAAPSGTFNGGAMPGGIAVNYSNNGVFLVVTGAVTLSAPFIVSQPASVESAAGAGAVFTASAGGAAPMGYQWQFNGVDLADNNRVKRLEPLPS